MRIKVNMRIEEGAKVTKTARTNEIGSDFRSKNETRICICYLVSFLLAKGRRKRRSHLSFYA